MVTENLRSIATKVPRTVAFKTPREFAAKAPRFMPPDMPSLESHTQLQTHCDETLSYEEPTGSMKRYRTNGLHAAVGSFLRSSLPSGNGWKHPPPEDFVDNLLDYQADDTKDRDWSNPDAVKNEGHGARRRDRPSRSLRI